jgi:hypothetical protein
MTLYEDMEAKLRLRTELNEREYFHECNILMTHLTSLNGVIVSHDPLIDKHFYK